MITTPRRVSHVDEAYMLVGEKALKRGFGRAWHGQFRGLDSATCVIPAHGQRALDVVLGKPVPFSVRFAHIGMDEHRAYFGIGAIAFKGAIGEEDKALAGARSAQAYAAGRGLVDRLDRKLVAEVISKRTPYAIGHIVADRTDVETERDASKHGPF